MKKITIILTISLFFGQTSFSQGVNFGFCSGTQMIKLELGYSINDNIHVGGYFAPGLSFMANYPTSFGGYFRYSFDDKDLNMGPWDAAIRGYVGADAGLMRTKGGTQIGLFGDQTVDPKTNFGVSGFGGGEILYGRSAKFGTFIEGHVGMLPSIFTSLNNSTADVTSTTDQRNWSFFGVLVGFRFYL